MRVRIPVVVLVLAFAAWSSAGQIVVRPGDTLWSLARAHDTTVEDLMAANGLDRPDLRPGDVLTLPGGGDPPPAAPATWTVRSGDSLWSIARSHDTTVEELMAANELRDAALQPGDVLVLPGTASAELPAAPSPSSPAPATAADAGEAGAAAAPAPTTWTVRPGDTLYEIAGATGTRVSDLMTWNGLSGSTIRPGDELVLASDGRSAPSATPLRVTVGPGDSLWRIARLNDTTPAAIAAANGMSVDAVLQPGDRLLIPGAFADTGPAVDRGGFAAPTITVDPGDSLWEIARRYGTSVDALVAANDLSSTTLRVGQELRVVAADGRSAPPAARIAVADDPTDATAADTMVWPLDGVITSRFGWRALRIGGSNMHYGLDIDGHTGDPIVAATGGTVTYADWMGGFGKLVIIEQGGTEYYYAHASELLVRVGQQVAPGALIARVGTTGRVTGSHLHFEIRVDGTPIDPLPVLEARAGSR
jgi:murein DD-endopeptidase MepM/ murein hydrolase activator NlpD